MEILLLTKFNLAIDYSHLLKPNMAKSTMTTSDVMDVKMTYRTDYLELPVLARVDLFNEQDVQFNFYVGPSVGYALSQEYIGENAALGTEDPFQKGDFKEDIEWDTEYGDDGVKDNRFDFSAVAGVGVTVETEVGNFVFDARYNVDFTDATIYENTPSPEPDKFYNRGISVTAGFAFPISW